ncbi:AraC family transcriptional regulator [Rhizobium sp. 60-20]|uniref:helix-turn-helix domain-containing protein n=1 Tax=Rhizobium sp. 60-20 TaxID=1895819 RepID=UPI001AC7BF67|nr:AraC family transcriptional regulator [Rhizobium sp. 60-20]MBN8949855.1 helix-turn-helix transcriptional regulator [Rhizobium tropici]
MIQPILDRHESWSRPGRPLHLLRLPWRPDMGFGGLYRIPEVDLVIRTARRDAREASAMLHGLVKDTRPLEIAARDWPDLLAADIRAGAIVISDWARNHGLARETVCRGFARTYGVSPRDFRVELKTRAAWMRLISDEERLAIIAAEYGFADQPHMTRAVFALTGASPGRWRRLLASHAFKTERNSSE